MSLGGINQAEGGAVPKKSIRLPGLSLLSKIKRGGRHRKCLVALASNQASLTYWTNPRPGYSQHQSLQCRQPHSSKGGR